MLILMRVFGMLCAMASVMLFMAACLIWAYDQGRKQGLRENVMHGAGDSRDVERQLEANRTFLGVPQAVWQKQGAKRWP